MSRRNDPMVSCLMVTLPVPQRFRLLQRSVASYCRQTHASKELIIVTDAGAAADKAAIADYVSSLGRSDIRLVDPPAKLALGALRNLSAACAAGSVLCQWDDDDLHHPRRLEQQLTALVATGSQAVCLQGVMLYLSASRTLYCTNWHPTPSKNFPASLICRRSALVPYPETPIGEDTAVALRLQESGVLHTLTDMPHLYVYVAHGSNCFDPDHYKMLADKLAISRGLLVRQEARLREELGCYDFGAGSVAVEGRNGPAFALGEPVLSRSP